MFDTPEFNKLSLKDALIKIETLPPEQILRGIESNFSIATKAYIENNSERSARFFHFAIKCIEINYAYYIREKADDLTDDMLVRKAECLRFLALISKKSAIKNTKDKEEKAKVSSLQESVNLFEQAIAILNTVKNKSFYAYCLYTSNLFSLAQIYAEFNEHNKAYDHYKTGVDNATFIAANFTNKLNADTAIRDEHDKRCYTNAEDLIANTHKLIDCGRFDLAKQYVMLTINLLKQVFAKEPLHYIQIAESYSCMAALCKEDNSLILKYTTEAIQTIERNIPEKYRDKTTKKNLGIWHGNLEVLNKKSGKVVKDVAKFDRIQAAPKVIMPSQNLMRAASNGDEKLVNTLLRQESFQKQEIQLALLAAFQKNHYVILPLILKAFPLTDKEIQEQLTNNKSYKNLYAFIFIYNQLSALKDPADRVNRAKLQNESLWKYNPEFTDKNIQICCDPAGAKITLSFANLARCFKQICKKELTEGNINSELANILRENSEEAAQLKVKEQKAAEQAKQKELEAARQLAETNAHSQEVSQLEKLKADLTLIIESMSTTVDKLKPKIQAIRNTFEGIELRFLTSYNSQDEQNRLNLLKQQLEESCRTFNNIHDNFSPKSISLFSSKLGKAFKHYSKNNELLLQISSSLDLLVTELSSFAENLPMVSNLQRAINLESKESKQEVIQITIEPDKEKFLNNLLSWNPKNIKTLLTQMCWECITLLKKLENVPDYNPQLVASLKSWIEKINSWDKDVEKDPLKQEFFVLNEEFSVLLKESQASTKQEELVVKFAAYTSKYQAIRKTVSDFKDFVTRAHDRFEKRQLKLTQPSEAPRLTT